MRHVAFFHLGKRAGLGSRATAVALLHRLADHPVLLGGTLPERHDVGELVVHVLARMAGDELVDPHRRLLRPIGVTLVDMAWSQEPCSHMLGNTVTRSVPTSGSG